MGLPISFGAKFGPFTSIYCRNNIQNFGSVLLSKMSLGFLISCQLSINAAQMLIPVVVIILEVFQQFLLSET